MSRRFLEAGMYELSAEIFHGEVVLRFNRYIPGKKKIDFKAKTEEYIKLPQVEVFAMSVPAPNHKQSKVEE